MPNKHCLEGRRKEAVKEREECGTSYIILFCPSVTTSFPPLPVAAVTCWSTMGQRALFSPAPWAGPRATCFPLSCRYHLMYKPPPTMEIQARLLQNPKDSEEQVKLQMDQYYRKCTELEQFYEQAITLNGDQDPYTVFEYLESGIINPLPSKVP